MLKVRTLGPEHLETQTQLRRNIRVRQNPFTVVSRRWTDRSGIQAMHESIQTLEDTLQASKKKLNQMKTGKPGLRYANPALQPIHGLSNRHLSDRAPSLDTINRTYRNIDIAIGQQADDVASLASRISQLDLSTSLDLPSARDPRLPDRAKRPFNVTNPVAITTAAALNAERSAQKLKHALLATRKEPLLNTTAVSAPAPPTAFKTPQKLGPATNLGFSTPDNSHLVGFDFPDESSREISPSGSRRGAGFKRNNIARSVKRSPGNAAAQGPPAPAFDWGPLPTFNPPAKSTLVVPITRSGAE